MKKKLFMLAIIMACSSAFAQNIPIFIDSTTGDYVYKFTYGQSATGSSLQFHKDSEHGTNPLLPVVTTPVHGGTHALMLKYLSAQGGGWTGEIRLRDKTDSYGSPRDITGYKKISMWFSVNREIAPNKLPQIRLGNKENPNQFTSPVKMSDYFSLSNEGDVKADTWYSIEIPLEDLPEFTFKSDVLKFQFMQNAVDDNEITLYVDDIVISMEDLMTSIDYADNTEMVAVIINGESYPVALGELTIYNTMGNEIFKGETVSSQTLDLNLAGGVYILKASNKNTKIMVK